jgi:lipoprotein-releasing system ATP-binding protein
MLDVSNLTKQYPTPRGPLPVLGGVSFTLREGDAAAVMGPSGSTVTLDGRDPFSLAPSALADFRNTAVGFVFQDHCLLPQCSVIENVLVPTLVARTGSSDDEVRFARELIEAVGLTDRIDHRPAELSGGERQRVAVARALIRRPRLLLCDEPTGNLDAASAAMVTSMLLDLHRRANNILIVVTHSAAVAERLPVQFDLDRGRLTPHAQTAARDGR